MEALAGETQGSQSKSWWPSLLKCYSQMDRVSCLEEYKARHGAGTETRRIVASSSKRFFSEHFKHCETWKFVPSTTQSWSNTRKWLTLKCYAKKILYFLRQQNIFKKLKAYLEQPEDQQSILEVTLEQIEHLHRRFKHISGDQPTIRKESFDRIPDLEFNPLRSKIVRAFFDKRNLRQAQCGLADEISFEDFLTIMSYFRPVEMNTDEEQLSCFRKEKLKFLFHMYDSDSDGKISLHEYRKVVEELLSRNPHLEKEVARSIADGAMMEAASICVGQMEPDQVYEGITFEDFLKLWQGIDIDTKMHVRFLTVETIAHCY